MLRVFLVDGPNQITEKNVSVLQTDFNVGRRLCWGRLGIALVLAVVSLFFYLLESTPVDSLLIQLASSVILAAFSFGYLFYLPKTSQNASLSYLMSFLDIGVVTGFLVSFRMQGHIAPIVVQGIYMGFLLVILMTAFHPRIFLGIVIGITAAVLYGGLAIGSTQEASTHLLLDELLLILISVMSSLISMSKLRSHLKADSSDIRYHNLVHRLPEMIFTLDTNGNFVWANSASYNLIGLPPAALKGRNLRLFLMRPELFRFDTKGVKGTFELQDHNRNRKFVDCILQYSKGDSTQPVYEGIMADVTDRELAIVQREEMVNRLFQYQKMESLGTLASGMAHDFNNIMQTVRDITSLVLRESCEEETRRRMELVDETMADAKFLVSELFALGRKKPFDHKAVNVNQLLEALIPHFNNQLSEKYEIVFKNPDQVCWIQGDPDYLKRVFQNLFGNARDAMPEGGRITVSIELINDSADSGCVVIRVSDMGTGIPPELREKVFDPFFTTKKPGKGTGLGLALVRRIIMLHNGNITVERSSSSGTVFRIEMPSSEPAEGEDDATMQRPADREVCTVLLLDDDPKIRDVLKFFLREFHYPVCEASNSEEAKVELGRHVQDCRVVIMDWNIGNEDPGQVISLLREIRGDLAVIVVSGHLPDQKKITRFGIQKWFTKPYDKFLLDLEIQKALNRLATTAEV